MLFSAMVRSRMELITSPVPGCDGEELAASDSIDSDVLGGRQEHLQGGRRIYNLLLSFSLCDEQVLRDCIMCGVTF